MKTVKQAGSSAGEARSLPDDIVAMLAARPTLIKGLPQQPEAVPIPEPENRFADATDEEIIEAIHEYRMTAENAYYRDQRHDLNDVERGTLENWLAAKQSAIDDGRMTADELDYYNLVVLETLYQRDIRVENGKRVDYTPPQSKSSHQKIWYRRFRLFRYEHKDLPRPNSDSLAERNLACWLYGYADFFLRERLLSGDVNDDFKANAEHLGKVMDRIRRLPARRSQSSSEKRAAIFLRNYAHQVRAAATGETTWSPERDAYLDEVAPGWHDGVSAA